MKVLCGLLLSVLLAGCASSDEIQRTYRDPAIDTTFAKLLVVGAHDDRNVRGQFENSVVRALRAMGATGESSLFSMGSADELNAETLLATAQRVEADAVLVTRVLDVQSTTEVTEGRSTAAATRRDDSFVDFFRYDYVEYEDPLEIESSHTVLVRSDLYNVADQAKIWSADSTAFDKENLNAVIYGITSAVTEQLRADGLID